MHPTDCPEWEYGGHPQRKHLLPPRVETLLVNLRNGLADSATVAEDTRRSHHFLFQGLTPPSCGYFAGNYRGAPYRCLKYYEVRIRGDDRVGHPSGTVSWYMAEVAKELKAAIHSTDDAHQLPEAQMAAADKLYCAVVLACRAFELVLRIHPYANGNGHAARLIVWALLGRYGYWPQRWPVEPRPPDPPYTQLLVEYRNGNQFPLERYILSSITNGLP